MRNVQSRSLDPGVGRFLDRLATDDDVLWPTPWWPPLRLDRGLRAGSAGGHGPIRYHVVDHEPGRRVRCVFDPPTGIVGYHEFAVEGSTLVHRIEGRTRGRMLIGWPLAFRWLHEALLRDLLDNAELALTGHIAHPSRHSVWVRLLRRLAAKRPQRTDTAERGDLADAWSIPIAPGGPTDPQAWADAIFRDPPRWVGALLLLRNRLVRLVGIPPATRHAFDTLAVQGNELVLGTDDVHLNFRARLGVTDRRVTLSTVANANNRRGRFYLAVVRIVHPTVVRAMLAHAARRLAVTAPRPPLRAAARPNGVQAPTA